MKDAASTDDPPWLPPQLDPFENVPNVDFWNLLSFDYSDPHRVVAQANLLSNDYNRSWTVKSTEELLRFYQTWIPLNTVNLGVPLFGRKYCDTESLPGSPYAICQDEERPPYNELPVDPVVNSDLITAWAYDQSQQQLVSYDSLEVLIWKYFYLEVFLPILAKPWWVRVLGDQRRQADKRNLGGPGC